eukprot:CAMPEP_0178956670 /NCGR_PEP_ID=MMETSP0789-20121207/10422_1 /TAXON_ID=3005 /ORGANISM="Rhizosolenia setigera, Strain CCMP 1694" /LENGTH=149 /DNA_ID=CAMNT_0020638703 /DNA_START=119 /DNA_END=565 /DNA_ORIENTATION=-
MSTIDSELKPYALLGGYNAKELWPTVNLILPTWFLLAVAPRWKYTPTLTLAGPIIIAAIYTLSAISMMFTGEDGGNASEIDFSTLEGIVTLFKDPNGVFVGWVHYVVYDALVGRWIMLDSVERGCSTMVHVLVIVPCLFLALMFGPMGW